MEYEYTLRFSTTDRAVAASFVKCFEHTVHNQIDCYDWDTEYGSALSEYSNAAGQFEKVLNFPMCDSQLYSQVIENCMKSTAQNVDMGSFTSDFIIVNCSSDWDNVHMAFKYLEGKLYISYTNAVSSGLYYCDECEAELEYPIASIETHTFGRKYKCPECGAEVSFEEEGYGERVVDIDAVEKTKKTEIDCLSFESNSDGLTLVACNVEESTIRIPQEADGKQVTCLGTGLFDNVKGKRIYIPDTVKRIENAAFSAVFDCEIYFPKTLTELTEDILIWGENIRIHIPGTVTSIHVYAFGDAEPTIVAEKGSFAEKYAKDNELPFEEESI